MDRNYLNSTTHNVAWLLKRFTAEELQLKAPFQRNPVWTEKQKSYLIDTILHGFPIPELYMQEYTDAEGNDAYVVVDGQQRVRACLEYVSGNYPLSEKDSPEWGGMYFDDLDPEDRRTIYNYNFLVRVLPDVPEVDLRAIFSRLNRHVVALNRQELRHATYWGEFLGAVEALADEEDWQNFAIFTPNDIRRMLDIEYVSELAVGYLHGLQNKKDTLDRWYQAYELEFPDRKKMERAFRTTLGEIRSCLPEISSSRWRKKSDFYSLFLCMAEKSDTFPLSKGEREKVGEALLAFGADVDEYLRDPDHFRLASKSVKDYSGAVERAASDLARRRTRRLEIKALLDPLII